MKMAEYMESSIENRLARLERITVSFGEIFGELRDFFEELDLAKIKAEQRNHGESLAAIDDAVAQMGQAIRNLGELVQSLRPKKPPQ